MIESILKKSVAGERLTPAEGLQLLTECDDLALLGAAANAVTNRLHPENYRTYNCLLYTSPSPRDATLSRMPSSA